MKACGGRTPCISASPFGDADNVASDMTQSCSRNSLKRLKKLCLERDNYRCVITNWYAMEAVGKFPNVPDGDIRKHTVKTDISHIIPFALGRRDEGEDVSIYMSKPLYVF